MKIKIEAIRGEVSDEVDINVADCDLSLPAEEFKRRYFEPAISVLLRSIGVDDCESLLKESNAAIKAAAA